MKRLLFVVALALPGILGPMRPASAQQPGRDRTPPPSQDAERKDVPRAFAVWKAELPGGSYVVARNAISAVGMQQYVLDGVARVTEVNISTTGDLRPRFYFLEMIPLKVPVDVPGAQDVIDRAQKEVKDLAARVTPGEQPWEKVVKNYPSTTHAGTLEFRLETKEQLQSLFDSVERTWLTGKSEVYSPAGVRPLQLDEELKNKDADDDENGEGGPGASPNGGGSGDSSDGQNQ